MNSFLRYVRDEDTFSAFAIMGMRIGMLAAKLILSIFIARYLGLKDLGIYGLIVGVSSTVQAVTRGGVFTLLARDAVVQSLPELMRNLRHYGIGVSTLYVLFIPVALAIGIYFDATLAAVLALAVFFTEHFSLDSFNLINNLQYPKIANFVYSLQSAIWIYLFVVLAFIYPSLRSIEAVLIFWTGGGVVALAIVAWLSRNWPWKEAFAGKLDWRWYPQKIRRAFKLYLIEVLGILNYYMDRYIVTIFLSLEMAGIYIFFSQIVTATLNLINSGVLAVYRPRLIKAYDSADIAAFNKIFKSCLVRSTLTGIFLAFFAAAASSVIVKLTGNEALSEHISLLWILLVAMLFVLVEVTAQTGLFAMHKDHDNFIITITSLFLTITVGSIAITAFGVYGIVFNIMLVSIICLAYASIVWKKKSSSAAYEEKKRYV